MKKQDAKNTQRVLRKRLLRQLMWATALLILWWGVMVCHLAGVDWMPSWKNDSKILNPERRVIDPNAPVLVLEGDGVDWKTGLKIGPHWQTVRAACTACHSAKLVTQNRATRQGWEDMLRWMQAEQGLPDLGANEDPILDYLSTYYAPEPIGRRHNLEVEQWYDLTE